MMKQRKHTDLLTRNHGRSVCFVLLCLIIFGTQSVSQVRLVHAANNYCVYVFNEFDTEVLSVASANPQTGQLTSIIYPIVPPIAMFSPDGKYAAFWQALPNQQPKGGLYVTSVADNKATLLATTPDTLLATLVDKYHADYWSSDSKKFAYIDPEDGIYKLKVLNADGSNLQEKTITPKLLPQLSNVSFRGWSADSKYIAAAFIMDDPKGSGWKKRFELQVWSVNDLAEQTSGIELGGGFSDENPPIAWSPNGHRLAIELNNSPEQDSARKDGDEIPDLTEMVAIWSPENSIEAQSQIEQAIAYIDEYNDLEWSPGGTQIHLRLGNGHGYTDFVYGIRGSKLPRYVPDDEASFGGFGGRNQFVAWTVDDAALIEDIKQIDGSDKSKSEVYVINVTKDYRKTLRDFAFVSAAFSNSTYAAVTRQDGVNGLLNLQTLTLRYFKKTKFVDSLWSPNKKYVAFGAYPFGQDLEKTDFIVDLTTLKRIDLGVLALAWLDDQWVVYDAKRASEIRLELKDLKTNRAYDLGKLNDANSKDFYVDAYDLAASISPDHRVVVATTAKSKPSNLISVSLSDGKKLLYFAKRGRIIADFYSLMINHGTDLNWKKYRLAWSPDSQWLAITEGLESAGDLVVLNSDMQEVMRLDLAQVAQDTTNFWMSNLVLDWRPCESTF